jgi:hypothetical protein
LVIPFFQSSIGNKGGWGFVVVVVVVIYTMPIHKKSYEGEMSSLWSRARDEIGSQNGDLFVVPEKIQPPGEP